MIMGIGKQAKVLTDKQVKVMVMYLSSRRNGIRNRVIFLLSVKSGLRSKEISCLNWKMVLEPDGGLSDSIHLTNSASKGQSGRVIPINKDLKNVFSEWLDVCCNSPDFDPSSFIIRTERSESTG